MVRSGISHRCTWLPCAWPDPKYYPHRYPHLCRWENADENSGKLGRYLLLVCGVHIIHVKQGLLMSLDKDARYASRWRWWGYSCIGRTVNLACFRRMAVFVVGGLSRTVGVGIFSRTKIIPLAFPDHSVIIRWQVRLSPVDSNEQTRVKGVTCSNANSRMLTNQKCIYWNVVDGRREARRIAWRVCVGSSATFTIR